jgi:hypothetical protein
MLLEKLDLAVNIPVHINKLVLPGNHYRKGRLSTVGLLVKVACFVKKVNNK